MSHSETISDAKVIEILKVERDNLRAQLEAIQCAASKDPRPLEFIIARLSLHANQGKGLMLNRNEYITPKEIRLICEAFDNG